MGQVAHLGIHYIENGENGKVASNESFQKEVHIRDKVGIHIGMVVLIEAVLEVVAKTIMEKVVPEMPEVVDAVLVVNIREVQVRIIENEDKA